MNTNLLINAFIKKFNFNDKDIALQPDQFNKLLEIFIYICNRQLINNIKNNKNANSNINIEQIADRMYEFTSSIVYLIHKYIFMLNIDENAIVEEINSLKEQTLKSIDNSAEDKEANNIDKDMDKADREIKMMRDDLLSLKSSFYVDGEFLKKQLTIIAKLLSKINLHTINIDDETFVSVCIIFSISLIKKLEELQERDKMSDSDFYNMMSSMNKDLEKLIKVYTDKEVIFQIFNEDNIDLIKRNIDDEENNSVE